MIVNIESTRIEKNALVTRETTIETDIGSLLGYAYGKSGDAGSDVTAKVAEAARSVKAKKRDIKKAIKNLMSDVANRLITEAEEAGIDISDSFTVQCNYVNGRIGEKHESQDDQAEGQIDESEGDDSDE